MNLDKVTWSEMLDFISARPGTSIQVLVKASEYVLRAYDGVFGIQHNMDRAPSDSSDLDDFELNYLIAGNVNGQIGKETYTADRKLRVSPSAELNAPAGVESVDNAYRVKVYWKDHDGPEIVLDTLNTPVTWTDIFSVNGNGKFFSFKAVFNSDDIMLRFLVDGVEVFNIDGESIEDLSFGNDDHVVGYPEIFWSRGDDKSLVFRPKPTSILYSTNLTLQAHARDDKDNRKCYGYTISYTEET